MPKTNNVGDKNPLVTEDHVAIICPTKDQPDKVERLLRSICNLKTLPGQIIIADGGRNLKTLIEQFDKILNITCLYCPEPGQVLQRKYAHKFLFDEIRLVLHIDDDNSFRADALCELLDFWNSESNNKRKKLLAGVSFNVVDLPIEVNSFFRGIAFLSTEPAGTVSLSGYARPFSPTNQNTEISWLLGGSTAWSREILERHPHPIDFSTKWAVCEDLIYSYPIGKNYRLMIAKDATAFHNETYNNITFRKSIFYGFSSSIMRYFFVATNAELSKLAFIWMTFCVALGHLARALCGSKKHAGLFFGNALGLSKIVLGIVLAVPPKRLARNLVNSRFAKNSNLHDHIG